MGEALVIRRRLPDGSFGDPVKPFGGETYKEKAERLEETSAEILYNAMLADATLAEVKDSHAEMMYQLMMNGVI